MLAADIPTKFPIPFANTPDSGTSRVVPLAPPVEEGAASLQKGFTSVNMTPVAAGGVPPFGQDFNGLFNQITAWSRWCAAGAPVKYDATFQTAISGYPAGAYVMSAVQLGLYWLSTTDNNVTDPDAAGAGWARYSAPDLYAVAGGTANALTATFSPVPVAFLAGQTVKVKATATNTGAVTINPNGLGAIAVTTPAGGALDAGAIVTGAIVTLVYDGASFQATAGVVPATTSPAVLLFFGVL